MSKANADIMRTADLNIPKFVSNSDRLESKNTMRKGVMMKTAASYTQMHAETL